MSEITNPLNDFLEMEENDEELFTEFPFDTPPTQPAVQSASAQPQTAAVPPAAQAPVVQMPAQPMQAAPQQMAAPVQNTAPTPAQGSLFEEAVAKTPIAQIPVTPMPAAHAPAAADELDPLTAALAKAKEQTDSRLIAGCVSRDAVFSYGKAKDPITDHECTFEDLRTKYESDFPELSESKRVSWTVTYGKESKSIPDPGSDKVYAIKAEIERSKKFLEGIRQAKTDLDKNPECIVKPYIKAQSKGEVIPLSSYKEFCSTEDEAQQSSKAIVILPSSDGRIYQMRRTPVGSFVAQTDHLPEFPHITPSFRLSLPKIPMNILLYIWDFFAELSEKYKSEALVHILYDTESGEYIVSVPKQRLTHTSVDSVMEEEYPEHIIHVMDMHSHNTMPAEFSLVDDADEKPTRLYAVMGRLDKAFPDITVRASCGGKFIPVEPTEVFDTKSTSFSHPEVWDQQLQLPKPAKAPMLPVLKRHKLFRIGEKI